MQDIGGSVQESNGYLVAGSTRTAVLIIGSSCLHDRRRLFTLFVLYMLGLEGDHILMD